MILRKGDEVIDIFGMGKLLSRGRDETIGDAGAPPKVSDVIGCTLQH